MYSSPIFPASDGALRRSVESQLRAEMRKRAYSVCDAYSIGQPYEAGVPESARALTGSSFAATALASHTPSLSTWRLWWLLSSQ